MLYVQEAQDPGVETVARVIGQRVRAGRRREGWTLDQLARRSGVSRRMLVNIEQGGTNPSIATLLRLADALGIGLPSLVDPTGEGSDPVVVRRAGEAPAVWTTPAGGAAVMVAGTDRPEVVELWDWRLGPDDVHRSDAHRTGARELLLVLSGTLELVVGDDEYRLRSGDSVTFDGALPHAYRNASATRPARFALAVYEPTVEKEYP